MKIQKLGIEWGAAHEEAQPVLISHGDARVEIYVTEGNDLMVKIRGNGYQLAADDYGATITLKVGSS